MQGILDGLNHLVDLAVPEFNQQGGTRIVPGHGRIANQSDVVEYRDMATIVRDRVRDARAMGRTLDQIKAAKVTLEYDGLYSTPSYTGDMFVEAIYNDLSRIGLGSAAPAKVKRPRKASSRQRDEIQALVLALTVVVAGAQRTCFRARPRRTSRPPPLRARAPSST